MLQRRRAFTLIELLVVIAIIAILAAILFPVFAQAKSAAKKTADLSNKKQVGTAMAIYLTDADDCYPLGYRFTPAGAGGNWRWNFSVSTPIGWMGNAFAQGQEPRMTEDRNHWSNTLLPYMKNLGLYESPGQPSIDVYGYPTSGKNPAMVNVSYNGLLHGYNASGVIQPADIPLVWGATGAANKIGNSLTDPALVCSQDVSVAVCVYNPAAAPGGTMFAVTNSMWAYSQGVNWTMCDTHTKFRKIGQTRLPGQNNPYTDPMVWYTSSGIPCDSTGTVLGGYYWWDGFYAWLFRPDYTP